MIPTSSRWIDRNIKDVLDTLWDEFNTCYTDCLMQLQKSITERLDIQKQNSQGFYNTALEQNHTSVLCAKPENRLNQASRFIFSAIHT